MARGFGGHKGGWKSMGQISRQDIKSLAKVVYVCRGCQCWNEPRFDQIKDKHMPPPSCMRCGRMDFDYFQSKGEARWYAGLLLRQKVGEISEVQRQVRIPLLTVDLDTGKPKEWAVFVADASFLDDKGRRIVGEYKPAGGMSYDAQLKIRCCEAMGIPVTIFTS